VTHARGDGWARICDDYLTLADRHASGLVEGLYLQGSVALGDYRAGVSDIDFVAVTSRAGPAGLSAWATTWGVLGVARLRHTLAAGRVTSKSAAGHALRTYDQRWHRVVEEALRIRVGGPPLYRNPWRRRADLVGFLTEALAS
jgi:hypothetical protein